MCCFSINVHAACEVHSRHNPQLTNNIFRISNHYIFILLEFSLEMSTSRLFIAGDGVHVARVVSMLTSYDALCKDNSIALPSSSESLGTGGGGIPFHLSTKYYNAELEIFPLVVESSSKTLSSSVTDMLAVASEGEGIILVLPPPTEGTEGNEMDALTKLPLMQVGCEAANMDALAIKVLVRLYNNNALVSQKATESSILWTIDNGYEYIEVNESNLTQGWQEREKEGLPRLMEALQSTMWSCMTKKMLISPTPAGQSVTTIGTSSMSTTTLTSASTLTTGEGEGTVESVFQVEASLIKGDNDNADTAVDGPSTSKTQTTSSNNNTVESSATITTTATTTAASGESTSSTCTEHGEDVEDFSDLMDQARRLRDRAAAGNMSDEDRRRQAEEMALKLAKLMNLCDDDDDDTDDEEE